MIIQIVYTPGFIPPKLPTYVVMEFYNYIGPPWDQCQPKHIPIPPIQRSNRKQIPLKMAWELTIHKSQGLTLTRSTIDIGNTERQGFEIHRNFTNGNITRNVNCTIVLLWTICKDERHFICLTSKERRGTPAFSISFTFNIVTLNPCPNGECQYD